MSDPFFLTALFAGLAASIASGVMGSYVVIKRIVLICGSISHSILGGMGLFLFLNRTYGWPLRPIHGALFAAIIAALMIGYVRLHYKQREDTIIAALWALGMSIGVIFTSLTPGYNVELMNFLFGNILWASRADIFVLLGLDAFVLVITAIFHRRFLAICFDEKQAQLQGLPVQSLYLLLLALVSITIVLLIQVVGAILVIAFLTLPAAIANRFTSKLSLMMLIAVGLGMGITWTGMSLSFALNWPSGATIALTATVIYLLSLKLDNRRKV